MDRWKIKRVVVQPGTSDDLAYLDEVLKAFWEPFSVTWDGNYFTYHLRQRDE